MTFRELLRALERDGGLDGHPGPLVSGRRRIPATTPTAPVERARRRRDPAARIATRGCSAGYTFLGRQVDVVETSRGCTFDCSFCSIIEMRGRNFHAYSLERVLDDIRDARDHGARAIFLVDDNITLERPAVRGAVPRDHRRRARTASTTSCRRMTSSIAATAPRWLPLMRRAGFRYVFLGIENILDDDLRFLRARAKNTRARDGQRPTTRPSRPSSTCTATGCIVVGGLIVGNPDDTRESIEANLEFARRYVDWPYIQHPTPYPRTPMTKEFRDRGLIINERLEEYDGTTAVVRTEHLEAEEIEFMRWRAERWIKVRHIGAVLRHSPGFVLPELAADARAHVPGWELLGLAPGDRRRAAQSSAAIGSSGRPNERMCDEPAR